MSTSFKDFAHYIMPNVSENSWQEFVSLFSKLSSTNYGKYLRFLHSMTNFNNSMFRYPMKHNITDF